MATFFGYVRNFWYDLIYRNRFLDLFIYAMAFLFVLLMVVVARADSITTDIGIWKSEIVKSGNNSNPPMCVLYVYNEFPNDNSDDTINLFFGVKYTIIEGEKSIGFTIATPFWEYKDDKKEHPVHVKFVFDISDEYYTLTHDIEPNGAIDAWGYGESFSFAKDIVSKLIASQFMKLELTMEGNRVEVYPLNVGISKEVINKFINCMKVV